MPQKILNGKSPIRDSNWITGGKLFKKDFNVENGFTSAKLTITAKGIYEAFLNGGRVGNFCLAPGFTSYNKFHQYQEYDITKMLKESSQLTVYVGEGWYCGHLAWENNFNIFGDKTALIAAVEIEYPDKTVVINTDASWEILHSPILYDSIYHGEIYDAGIEPVFVKNAGILDAPKENLAPQEGEYVTEHEELAPVMFFTTPKGEKVVDFGQNLTGYVEISVDAAEGDVVSLSFAEVMDKDGNFYNENYRLAKSQYIYTCKAGRQTYKPHLTFMGFRYARINEAPENTRFKAIAVYSDIKRTGFFNCSNGLINKLFENTVWGQKGNFLDVPTDCPQRDERLGWTGDAQAFVKAASFNFNVNKFFRKWLTDLSLDQFEDGNVPHVIPDVLRDNAGGSAAWGDAAVICPWQIYLTYGDKDLLARQFISMDKWLKFSRKPGREHFGDWLGLDAPEGSYKGASDEEYIRVAYNAYTTAIMIKICKVLGKDYSEYTRLYNEIIAEFKTGYAPKTQTEYVLALYFDLLEDKKRLASELAEMVIKNGTKLQTGFVGTPYLLHVLSDNGYTELSYSLLLQTGYPSWLYPVTRGATTIWEHWDGLKPDGSFWSKDMNSFNHYAYGAVVDWLYEVAAGIKIDENKPGFEHILINPHVDKRLGHLSASIDTKYGVVSSKWEFTGDKVKYEIETPVNATVTIGGETREVEKGVYTFGV
jgi:alpha-L-rhamnosidase